MRFNRIIFACLLGVHVGISTAAELFVSAPTLKGSVTVKSWKELRDAGVVKQDLDYSCGAASVATIMNGFYGFEVTEEALLETMAKDAQNAIRGAGSGAASFNDMAEVVRPYGLKGVGVALNFDQLRKLKTPAIAYLRYREDDHFSVIRGIAADGTVQLAESLPREVLWAPFMGQSPFYPTAVFNHVGDTQWRGVEREDSVAAARWCGSGFNQHRIFWC